MTGRDLWWLGTGALVVAGALLATVTVGPGPAVGYGLIGFFLTWSLAAAHADRTRREGVSRGRPGGPSLVAGAAGVGWGAVALAGIGALSPGVALGLLAVVVGSSPLATAGVRRLHRRLCELGVLGGPRAW